jgi:hypothetical protein
MFTVVGGAAHTQPDRNNPATSPHPKIHIARFMAPSFPVFVGMAHVRHLGVTGEGERHSWTPRKLPMANAFLSGATYAHSFNNVRR